MGNAYYGRRHPHMNMPSPYGRRTAVYGVCQDAEQPVMTEHDCHGMVLAMAYVPVQQWGPLYETEVGFKQGTIFPDLDKPFMKGGCGCGM